MEYRNIIKLINVINSSPISDDEKALANSWVLELYNCSKFSTDSNESVKDNDGASIGNNESLVGEGDQMKFKLNGICVGRKPRKDGFYQGYVTTNGKREYFYGQSPDEVAYKIRETLNARSEEFLSPREKIVRQFNAKKEKSPLFKDYVEKWLKTYKEPNLKPNSFNSLKANLKRPLEAFGDMPLKKITSDDIQRLLIGIKAPRARDLCRGGLAQIFRKATMQGVIDKNPCDGIELKRHKNERKKALTKSEQEIFLLSSAKTSHDLLFRFLLATGLRIGEALALTKEDVNFDKSTVTVNKNVIFIKGKRIVQDTPKSDAGNRTIPFPRTILQELDKITTFDLFPCSYNAVKKSIQRIAKETGLNVSPHILRHTYATRLEEAGIAPKLKQYLLGHASLEMTQNVYTDVQPDYVYLMSDKICQAV